MESSVLDSLGTDIIGVMSPVSICMLLVVLLVYSLAQPSAGIAPAVTTAATLVYQESPADPPAQKLEGALLNAAAFVALVAAVTFLLLLLYYYNFTGFLKNYMRFSAFFVLSSMGGSILLSLLQRFSLPLDALTCAVLLFNFAVVGVMSVFSAGVPILLRQGYMVALGIIVAAWFTKLPEWTTWTLLMALAVYDLVAVLAPGGPLKLLVELASSRDEELPALVYEARPNVSTRPATGSLELQPVPQRPRASAVQIVNLEVELVESTTLDPPIEEIGTVEEERSPLVGGQQMGSIERASGGSSSGNNVEVVEMTRGIKLGLGDFVFYSVLVGRAAMYDLMTVYACYLAIISGLGCTLILLSMCRQALPALPISITLGVIFYFLTRLLMEPFVVGASSNLVMF
uniref:Presenilin n=1 Tax=Anthurium amnicola TaxID=1678845 RepID=A0A1D1ZGQ0_9ARAE